MTREPDDPAMRDNDVTRRAFLEGAGATIAAAAALPLLTPADAAAQTAPTGPAGTSTTRVAITVNGTEHRLEVADHWTLAELLRERLALTGTKLGCERGECGACTVLLDGAPVYACSYLAVWADGRKVETVEGLSRNGQLSPLQQAFVEHDAPQCGYCTSGQLMAATALLRRNPAPTPADVREALAGNICRCSNYNRIVEAVVAAGRGGASRSQGGA